MFHPAKDQKKEGYGKEIENIIHDKFYYKSVERKRMSVNRFLCRAEDVVAEEGGAA
jgi:hypothetical protein